MRAVIFLVCLCFFALRGYNYIYAASQAINTCSASTQHTAIEKEQSPNLLSPGTTFLKTTPASLEDNYLIDEESEDDDINNLFVKKYKLLSGHIFCDPVTETYAFNCSATPQPFGSHLTDKYITQRVLRI